MPSVRTASATTYTAIFSTRYLLTAKVSPANAGTIAAAPASADGYYSSGTSVQITATPAAGHAFSAFTGDLTGPANPQSLILSTPRSVTAAFVTPPKLSIGLKHSGTFKFGQIGITYTVIVSNTSSSATSGTVTVSETIPSGMTLVSMSGTGWTCAATSSTCTRGDSLAGGASYPAITVAVHIVADSGPPLINSVSVSGGGAPPATATDSTAVGF